MFKKVLIGISTAMVLATGASAMDFCKTAENLFLGDGLIKKFYKYNQATSVDEACKGGFGTPTCRGVLEAKAQIANNVFNAAGYNAAMSLLNKYGIKKSYDKAQLYINYTEFFTNYLKNKLSKMNEKEKRIFLEKLYLFFNRVSDEIINLTPTQVGELDINFTLLKIFKSPLMFKDKNMKVTKEVINTGASAFIANTKLNGTDTIEGAAILALHPTMNLRYKALNSNKQGYSSKDPQLGGSAENLEKFFVYAATKQWDKAFNLIDKTYPNSFIKEFDEDIKEVCEIK